LLWLLIPIWTPGFERSIELRPGDATELRKLVADLRAHVALLRETHKRRPTLIALLDRAATTATAVIDFVTSTLIADPHRAGKPLRDDLAGVWSARRGTYRVLYRIRETPREVVVLRIDHRRDAYRPLS
jgi:mRNA-degrading endonuclease RelE of RelBE toxin-antitoxin system